MGSGRLRWIVLASILVITSVAPARSQSVPGYPAVVGEYLQVAGARAADTPGVLNRVHFLRLRSLRAEASGEVEAVVIAQPGFASTPAAWLQLGAQLVTRADQEACPIAGQVDRRCALEVWVIDRRGSNLEDTEGLRLALLARDPRVALDYYWGRSALTSRGTVRMVTDGDYGGFLGAAGARFEPLPQSEVPFLWDWGFETAAADLDALIDLLPKKARGTNVFVAGHSQGGGFVVNWAGRRGLGGDRGSRAVAGLVFLDGGPDVGDSVASRQASERHAADVEAIRSGAVPRYGAEIQGIELGIGLALRNSLQGLYYALRPDQEAIFPPSVRPAHPAAECFVFGYHLPPERCGGIGLRLTNRAHAGLAYDDDPVPGAFLQTPTITALGMRLGRLDFTPQPDTAGKCAAAGPSGEVPPCPPSHLQVDPQRVYGWLDGGADGAGPDGALNGWTTFDGGRTFVDSFLKPGPNPSRVEAYVQQVSYSPTRTNVVPVELRSRGGQRRVLDARVLNAMHWYQPRRYDLDLEFLGRFTLVRFAELGVSYDIDKTAIAAPVYVAARERRENPFQGVTDFTAIGPEGTLQSPSAEALSPFRPGLNSSLYGHSDFLAADDSQRATVAPGQPGSSVVADTLVDWMLARVQGTTKVPELATEDWNP
jgi:hypothetical protein